MLRSAGQVGAKLREPHRSGTFNALLVCARTMPSMLSRAGLEAAHAGLDVRIVDVGAAALASRSPETLRRWRSADHCRITAAEPQASLCATLGPAALQRCSRSAR